MWSPASRTLRRIPCSTQGIAIERGPYPARIPVRRILTLRSASHKNRCPSLSGNHIFLLRSVSTFYASISQHQKTPRLVTDNPESENQLRLYSYCPEPFHLYLTRSEGRQIQANDTALRNSLC